MAEVREIDAEEITRVVRELCMEICYYQATVKPWRRNGLLPEDLQLVVHGGNEGDGGGM